MIFNKWEILAFFFFPKKKTPLVSSKTNITIDALKSNWLKNERKKYTNYKLNIVTQNFEFKKGNGTRYLQF